MTKEELATQINKLSKDDKVKLISFWVAKDRLAEMRSLDILFALDDFWQSEYDIYRIKKGFYQAKVLANQSVFSLFIY